MDAPPAAEQLEALGAQVLAQALEDTLLAPQDGPSCDAGALEVLRQTAQEMLSPSASSATQVASSLQRLQLANSSSNSVGSRTSAAYSQQPPSSSDGSGTHADASTQTHNTAACFTGAPAAPLGVATSDLLAEALPPEAARRQALQAALPALEQELARRCRLVAAASGYDTTQDDFTGLPDHIRQLLAARAQASQVQAWRKAAQQAQQAAQALAAAGELLARLIRRHKLGGHKEADEAQAGALHCECVWLKEKVKLVQLQLQHATYSPEALGALRQVAAEVDSALGQATAQLQQASLQLAAYKAMGPQYAQLAAEHAGVLEALEEAEYELREVEQFQALAAVTG